jgi:hypothetical protein
MHVLKIHFSAIMGLCGAGHPPKWLSSIPLDTQRHMGLLSSNGQCLILSCTFSLFLLMSEKIFNKVDTKPQWQSNCDVTSF